MKTVLLPDGRELIYELTRKNVKNVNFRAKESGIVAVSASPAVGIDEIEKMLLHHADFFLKAFETLRKRGEFLNGSSGFAWYLGRKFPVRVIDDSREIAVLDEDECRVFTKSTDEEYIASLREKAVLARFAALCEELNNEVRETLLAKGFEPPQAVIFIKTMKSRWGSCVFGKGKISINRALAAFPRGTILSVFYHEYAHFWVHDHSKKFYDFLLKVYPEYYTYNSMLN